jgi:hypothetical protein
MCVCACVLCMCMHRLSVATGGLDRPLSHSYSTLQSDMHALLLEMQSLAAAPPAVTPTAKSASASAPTAAIKSASSTGSVAPSPAVAAMAKAKDLIDELGVFRASALKPVPAPVPAPIALDPHSRVLASINHPPALKSVPAPVSAPVVLDAHSRVLASINHFSRDKLRASPTGSPTAKSSADPRSRVLTSIGQFDRDKLRSPPTSPAKFAAAGHSSTSPTSSAFAAASPSHRGMAESGSLASEMHAMQTRESTASVASPTFLHTSSFLVASPDTSPAAPTHVATASPVGKEKGKNKRRGGR